MLKRLKKFRDLWKLSETKPEEAKLLEAQELPGKAVFLEDMTEEERNEYVRNEEEGWGKFLPSFLKK